MRRRIGFILIFLIPVSLFVWQVQSVDQPESRPTLPVPVLAATVTYMPTPTMTDRATAVPTDTATPTNTPTVSPTPSQTPTMTALPPTETATATATTAPVINRTCPNPPPAKPAYDRYFLSPQRWPQPDLEMATAHFWLSKPVPGEERYLTNQAYPYGYDGGGRYLLHNGVDGRQTAGTPVLAVADGTIVVAQADMSELFGWRCDWYGHLVVLELDQQWQGQPVYVLYGHVLNIQVEAGQRVARGARVAEIGFGGVALVPHLHLEVRVGTNEFGATRNPMLWIEPGEMRGVIAGRVVDPEGRPWQGVGLGLLGGSEGVENRNTWSYLGDPQSLMNPDEGWAENFLFSDVPPGEYQIYTRLQDVEYRVPVAVRAGEVSLVEVITEAFKTPTPMPEATVAP